MSQPPRFSLENDTILVTGVQGFIGIHTAAAGIRAGARIIGVDVMGQSDRADRVRESLGCPPITIETLDLLDTETTARLLREVRPFMIVHCAGSIERKTDAPPLSPARESNAVLTASLLDALMALPETQRPILVMPGSQMEYGKAPMPWTEDRPCEPVNTYGAGKLAATKSVLEVAGKKKLRACVLRLPIVFGPGQPPLMFVPELIGKALRKEAVPMTAGDQRRAFVYVEDAAELLLETALRIAHSTPFPTLLNAPACPPMAILDVAHIIADALNARDLLRVGACPKRPGEPLDAWPDTSLATSLELTARTPLAEALQKTIAWYQENPWFWEE